MISSGLQPNGCGWGNSGNRRWPLAWWGDMTILPFAATTAPLNLPPDGDANSDSSNHNSVYTHISLSLYIYIYVYIYIYMYVYIYIYILSKTKHVNIPIYM